MINTVELVSGGQQSDSVIHILVIYSFSNSFPDPFVVHEHDDWVFTLLRDMCLPPTLLWRRHITCLTLRKIKSKKIKFFSHLGYYRLLSRVPCAIHSISLVVVVVAQALSRVQFFWPHELQDARLLCSLLSPRVCSNSRPLSQWCHLNTSFSVAPFSFCIRVFSNELTLCTRWPKY